MQKGHRVVLMNMKMYSDRIKQAVTCRQLLEANGTKVDRHGFAVCPLHGDKDASLKVYGGNRGWVCYGCHKGGDVINLAREMYGVGFNDAIRRLNEEFNVGLDLDGKVSKKDAFVWKAEQIRKKYEALEEEEKRKKLDADFFGWLDIFRMTERLVIENEPKEKDGDWGPVFCSLLKMRETAYERLKEINWEWVAYGKRYAGL